MLKKKLMELKELLLTTVKNKASDLHLVAGKKPMLRIDGNLTPLDLPTLTPSDIEEMIFGVGTVSPEQKTIIIEDRELDFSLPIALSDGTEGRFRVNAYYQKNTLAGSFRYLEPNIRNIEQLNLPQIFHRFPAMRQGFVLVTGPTGHGKTTTLASMINEINQERSANIITIEDPIEYVYPPGKSIISQREIRADTHSWAKALRSVLREDPDVVLIGEMRDPETIASAITIAETGHLVFSTLHTNSASQTIDRIVDVFPPHQQGQIRTQLAATLIAICSQRLVPTIVGGRIPAVEIMLGTDAVRTNIREGKTHLLDNIIRTSEDIGMIALEKFLVTLVREGKITRETADYFALRPDELARLLE